MNRDIDRPAQCRSVSPQLGEHQLGVQCEKDRGHQGKHWNKTIDSLWLGGIRKKKAQWDVPVRDEEPDGVWQGLGKEYR